MPSARLFATFGVFAAFLPGQFGKRLTEVIDVTSIAQGNPLFANAMHVDFICRDPGQNWWIVVNGYVVKFDQNLNTLGAINAVPGTPVYEPSTDRLYFVSAQGYSVLVPCVPPGPCGPLGSWYTFAFGAALRCSYLDLNGGTAFVQAYAEPIPASPGHVDHGPRSVAADGAGTLLINTVAGDLAFDTSAGIPSPAMFSLPAQKFMVLSGSARCLVAMSGSCSTGPASTCINRRELATGVQEPGFPVDLSIPGPGAQRGGECVGIYPFEDQGLVAALFLMNGPTRTYAYLVDITSDTEWPGCSGTFTSGPFAESVSIDLGMQIPATVVWLVASTGYLQLPLPLLPAGCSTYLEPAEYAVLPPQLLPPGGQVNWSIPLPPDPTLDNRALYIQGIHLSLAGFGATDARSAIIRM